jgi:hypothetical protein
LGPLANRRNTPARSVQMPPRGAHVARTCATICLGYSEDEPLCA